MKSLQLSADSKAGKTFVFTRVFYRKRGKLAGFCHLAEIIIKYQNQAFAF